MVSGVVHFLRVAHPTLIHSEINLKTINICCVILISNTIFFSMNNRALFKTVLFHICI